MAKMTISIPDDLKARMDSVEQRVIWSAVSSAAFETKLGELSAEREKLAMSTVIERLRTSKLESEGEDYKAGYEAAQEWASGSAEYPELKNLSELFGRAQYEDFPYDAQQIAELADDNNVPDCFWEGVIPEDGNWREVSDTWLDGFMNGVSDFFDSVKDEI